MRALASAALVGLCAVIPAFAQTSAEGSIRGAITDEHGAALPGVVLTATSPDAPGIYSAVADGAGEYRLLNLPPGRFTLVAEKDGFAKYVR
jgi:hypothetical protein